MKQRMIEFSLNHSPPHSYTFTNNFISFNFMADPFNRLSQNWKSLRKKKREGLSSMFHAMCTTFTPHLIKKKKKKNGEHQDWHVHLP